VNKDGKTSTYHILGVGTEVGRALLRGPHGSSVVLVVHQVGVKGAHSDGALLVNLVDGPSQEVDDEVVELDFTNLGLQHFERLPCVFAQHAPDDHTMVAVHSLCQDETTKKKNAVRKQYTKVGRQRRTKLLSIIRINTLILVEEPNKEGMGVVDASVSHTLQQVLKALDVNGPSG